MELTSFKSVTHGIKLKNDRFVTIIRDDAKGIKLIDGLNSEKLCRGYAFNKNSQFVSETMEKMAYSFFSRYNIYASNFGIGLNLFKFFVEPNQYEDLSALCTEEFGKDTLLDYNTGSFDSYMFQEYHGTFVPLTNTKAVFVEDNGQFAFLYEMPTDLKEAEKATVRKFYKDRGISEFDFSDLLTLWLCNIYREKSVFHPYHYEWEGKQDEYDDFALHAGIAINGSYYLLVEDMTTKEKSLVSNKL